MGQPKMTTEFPETMISAYGLKRVYKTGKSEINAVRGVDLTVKRGEIVGFLGPNGAGKTTTLKMLCTLLEPTDGSGTVAGCDLRADSVMFRSQAARWATHWRATRSSTMRGSTASTGKRRSNGARRCSRPSTSKVSGIANATRFQAGSGGDSISSWA